MTAQNHGYAVDPAGLPQDVHVSHVNLNDGTVEGLTHTRLPGADYSVPLGSLTRPPRLRVPV